MSKFGSMKKLKVNGDSRATYVFTDLDGMPSVTCKPATRQNKKYFAAILSNEPVRRLLNSRSINDADVAAATDSLAELYAEHIIVDWSNMDRLTGEDGLKATKGNKKDFIVTLQNDADWVWEAFSAWTQENKNFVSFDVQEKAKN